VISMNRSDLIEEERTRLRRVRAMLDSMYFASMYAEEHGYHVLDAGDVAKVASEMIATTLGNLDSVNLDGAPSPKSKMK